MNKTSFRQEVMQILGIPEEKLISPEQEKTYYTAAFTLYEKKAYRKASHLFTTLVLTNPFAIHYWQGLASSKQMSREYEAALQAWSLVALLNTEDPLPHFHAGECLLRLNEKEEAEKALNAALALNQDPVLEIKINKLKNHDTP